MKPFVINQAELPIKLIDTNFMQFGGGLDANTDWNRIVPFLQKAIDFDIIPYLGQATFDVISSDLASESLMLRLLRHTCAEYAMSRAIPTLRLTIGNGGVAENTPQHSAPAPQWATRGAEKTALLSGDRYLDLLLAECEKSSDGYKASDEYKNRTTKLFKSTLDLNNYLNILNSRRTYESLIRYLKDAESKVTKLFCGDWILSASNDTIKNLVRVWVANTALATAVPFLRLIVEADGFKAVSTTDGFDDKKSLTNNNHAEAIVAMKNAAESKAEETLQEIFAYLKENKDEFETWRDSLCGQQQVGKQRRVIGDENGAVMLT